MAADYPTNQYSPRAKQNKSGIVYDATKNTIIFAEDWDNERDEIQAIEDAIGYGDNKALTCNAKCKVSFSINYRPGDTLMHIIPFDTKIFDPGNNFDTSTHKFTVPVAGTYIVNTILADLNAVGGNTLKADICKNGNTVQITRLTTVDFDDNDLKLTQIMNCSAGDTLHIEAQNQDTNPSWDGYKTYTNFSVHILSR